MTTPAIRVDSLGKRYHLTRSQERASYHTLRDAIMNFATAPLQKRERTEEFWALTDVSFEVNPGEVVGIIGRNGAGKSTLLKLLSRITKPTTGRIEINGRVGSLLEVGTGFHPELTGRENIYLNGSILGMSHKEISNKFDEIVAFAEVENFLDTPVKRYSSGMYVRLAFAVAAHLEPEILIVDEVLAVGDMNFQRKCMNRMHEVGKGGRTILFVSHNMAAMERLCTRAILLEQGRTAAQGEVSEIVREYNRRTLAESDGSVAGTIDERAGVIRSATLWDERGGPTNYVSLGETCRIRVTLQLREEVLFPVIGLAFDDQAGQRLLTVHTPLAGAVIERANGRCTIECEIRNFPLAAGDYWVKAAISSGKQEIEAIEQILFLRVVDGDAFGQGRGFTRGLCIARSDWRFVKE